MGCLSNVGLPPPPSIKFAGTHLYTGVERGNVRVKCLAQGQHNVLGQGSNPDNLIRGLAHRASHTSPLSECQLPPRCRYRVFCKGRRVEEL